MRITDALYGEHGSLYMLMNAIEGRLAGAELAELQTSAALFEAAILAHAHFENDPFFAALDRVMPGGGPVTAMRAEHEEIEGELAKVATSRDAGAARRSTSKRRSPRPAATSTRRRSSSSRWPSSSSAPTSSKRWAPPGPRTAASPSRRRAGSPWRRAPRWQRWPLPPQCGALADRVAGV